MSQFSPGQIIQYFHVRDCEWKEATYIGPRKENMHALEIGSGTLITVGEGRVRTSPVDQQLTGTVLIYRANDGSRRIFGPFRYDTEINNQIEQWNRIYPEGPDAIISLDKYQITYRVGDGLKGNGRAQ